MNFQRTLLTVTEAAQLLGVSRGWVYRHAEELPAIRLGPGSRAPIRIEARDLAEYLRHPGPRDRPEKAVLAN